MKKIIVCICILLLVGFCWVYVKGTDGEENKYVDSSAGWLTEKVSSENLESYQEQGAEMIYEANEAIGGAVEEVNQVIGGAVEEADEMIGNAVEDAMEGAAKGFWESIRESVSKLFK